MPMAGTIDPEGETLPWPQASEREAPARRHSLLLPALLVTTLMFAALAAWRLLSLLRYEPAPEVLRLSLTQGLAAAGLSLACALVAALLVWQRQRRTGQAVRQSADHLRRGAWQTAVADLREQPPALPSAFDELATQVEGVIGESDRRWRARAELSNDWYWETDTRGRLSCVSADAPIVGPAGRTPAEVIGRRLDELADLLPPDGGWQGLHRRMDRQERFNQLEVGWQVPGQPSRWLCLTGRPRWTPDGQFGGYEGLGIDVTDQRLAVQAARAQTARQSALLHLVADWHWSSDPQHRLLAPEPELERRLGPVAQREVGQARWEAWPDALSPSQWQAHREDLDARRPFRALEFAVAREDGRLVWMSLSGIALIDEQGRFEGYRGIGRDITLRKMAEAMMLKHHRELQHAVAARTRELDLANRDLLDFARQLAQELSGPLGQVQALAETLRGRIGDRLQADEAELLEVQRRTGVDMQSMLQAMLELARSSCEGLERQEVDLSAMALEVIAGLPAGGRLAPVQWDVQPGLTAWASGPQMRILLQQLLDNAAKFTSRAEHPRVALTGQNDTEGLLTLKVSDNGAGFDDARAERLFQPFQRLHGGHEYAGIGIGLAIAQRIVQRHGGRIAAASQHGRGTTIEFTLGQRAR